MSQDDSRIPWWKTDLGPAELRAIRQAILGRHINQGPVFAAYEQRLAKFLGVKHVVAVTNGSQALLVALMACGVRPCDEVVVPAFTFIATAHAAMVLGARVKLIDVGRDRPLLDPGRLESVISRRTKVIIPVHLNGRACDMQTINRIARDHGLMVVEDAAQAFGSTCGTKALGTSSHLGAFATDMTKIITTGEGGFLAVHQDGMYERICRLRNQGLLRRTDTSFDAFGFNFKFPDVLAAIGMAQLDRLEENMAAVKRVYGFYREHLDGLRYLRILEVRTDQGELPLWTEVLCAEREKVIERLRRHGIIAKALPPSLHRSKHLGVGGRFRNADFYGKCGMILPCGPGQSARNLKRVVEVLWKMRREVERM